MREPSATFGRTRVLLQLCLGFVSGLPLLLTGSTLTTWMTSVGVDLKTVGIFALVGLPYSFKFTWAPLLDRYRLPLLGRRRGWLLLFQLLLIVALARLGASDPAQDLRGLAAAALVVAFFAASQDIVTDAYRTDLLAPDERAAGTVTFVFGYRIGVLVAGALALILSEYMSFRSVYLLMAACMLVGVVTTILAPEPSGEARPPRTLLDAVVHPFRDLFSRPGVAAILGFIVAYKFGHALLGTMASPFAVKLGFSKAEIGAVNKGLGLVASIGGGLLAGALVPRLGTRRALLGFGGLQALAHLLYLVLALCAKSPMRHTLLVCAVGIDQFCTGLSMAPFDAYLMSLCDRKYSATQYALLTALSSVGARLFGAGSGYLSQLLGWPRFFLATLLLSLPGLALIRWLPASPQPTEAVPQPTEPAPPPPLTRARPKR